MTVIKIQRPLGSTDPSPPFLVYDESLEWSDLVRRCDRQDLFDALQAAFENMSMPMKLYVGGSVVRDHRGTHWTADLSQVLGSDGFDW